MELHPKVKDIYYPKADTTKIRETVKVILLNEKKEIALIHIEGSDIFGQRDHYELPGGGIDSGEKMEDTFYREMKEEVGVLAKPIAYLGDISIEYNLFKRTDLGHFFLGKVLSYTNNDLEEYEKALFKEIVWVKIDEIEAFYQAHKTILVGKMIHERDLAAIKAAKAYLADKLLDNF